MSATSVASRVRRVCESSAASVTSRVRRVRFSAASSPMRRSSVLWVCEFTRCLWFCAPPFFFTTPFRAGPHGLKMLYLPSTWRPGQARLEHRRRKKKKMFLAQKDCQTLGPSLTNCGANSLRSQERPSAARPWSQVEPHFLARPLFAKRFFGPP